MSGAHGGASSWPARRVRVLTVTTWPDDAAAAVDVVRTRACAPSLSWFDLVEHVASWALRQGCEVERYDATSGAGVLQVFSPDGRTAWRWVEPREACAECGTLAPLVQVPSGHVETDCACQQAERDDVGPCDDCARSYGPHYGGCSC